MKRRSINKEEPVSKSKKHVISDSVSFPIIGIGASAGGLEALELFFTNIPDNSGIAYVVIQHLDPTRIGIMPELLQRTTEMKVVQVTDNLGVKPNTVFIIPPNRNMSVLNGHFHLFEHLETRGLRLPVDYFFRSLADDQKDNSVGVILSGMGTDGSLGVKAIRENNGVVAVQEPESAKFDGMPRSAINEVTVDIIAPAHELPLKLISFLKRSPVIVKKTEIDEQSKSNLEKIVILLRMQTGHDFSLYKKTTMYRRIERRMNVHKIDKIINYVRFLQENPQELEILFKELLIGVTKFFRDTSVWDKLRDKCLPDLFKTLPNGYILRAWVTACSTGEEAYSLAMIFKEALSKVNQDKNITIQIFATDIDTNSIDKARTGFYSTNIINDVSAKRLSNFFVKEEDGYRVSSVIREMVVFATQNVIKDPPFTKLDFIFCRNLLIYMEIELQKKLMNLFYYSLNQSGLLVTGTSETPGKNLFETVDEKLKIFKPSVKASTAKLVDFPSSFTYTKTKSIDSMKIVEPADNLQKIVEPLLIHRFSPSSVLINSEGDILYITGSTGKYLEPATGKANMNIYAMVREGLQNELHSAIRKAKQNFNLVRLLNVKIGKNDNIRFVDVTLQQLEKPDSVKGTLLIVFNDKAKPARSKSRSKTSNSSEREMELEDQLISANEELRRTREDMQSMQEDLKSTNEEMQSTNEELQSTNEELTTSKEEMQSLNEELQTVNNELQSKINDFIIAENDMKNLLNSTEIATLFLDNELNIRRFTDQTTKLFKFRKTDIGRPFTDVVNKLRYPEITNDAKEVLRTLVFKEIEITTHDNRWFTVRIMPYNTIDENVDGVVITFIENTQLNLAINELIEYKSNFEKTLKNSNIKMAICDTELRYKWMYNQSPDFDLNEILGKRDDEIENSDENNELIKLKKKVLSTGKTASAEISFPVNGKKVSFHISANPIIDQTGNIEGVSTYSFICRP